MTSELDFFTKAQNASDIYREAAKHGRKVGRPPIFYAADAPAHLRNQLVQLPTEAEWQARLDREAVDPIRIKFGPGMTVMNLYHSPKGHYAEPGDPVSPLMAKVTPDELKLLWDKYFRNYPKPHARVGTKLFLAAVREEAARRGIM